MFSVLVAYAEQRRLDVRENTRHAGKQKKWFSRKVERACVREEKSSSRKVSWSRCSKRYAISLERAENRADTVKSTEGHEVHGASC
jgi:hypothetical protein